MTLLTNRVQITNIKNCSQVSEFRMMNSKQGTRYIKRRMGNDLKQKILAYNGIIPSEELERKPIILNCPRCNLVNAIENKYCSECSYPLVPSAFEEIKILEEIKINQLEKKYEKDMKEFREQTQLVHSILMFIILNITSNSRPREDPPETKSKFFITFLRIFISVSPD